MKKLLLSVAVGALLTSCQVDHVQNNQGIFTGDKDALRATMLETMETDNALAVVMLEKIVENAVLEFKIVNDSVFGFVFVAGKSIVIESKLEVRNDTMLFKQDSTEVYLVPNEKGLIFSRPNNKLSILLIRTDLKDFSAETKVTLAAIKKKAQEEKEFEDNLGKWQAGYITDEFGDKTEKGHPYSIIRGVHKTSTLTGSEIYVKAVMENDFLYFQFFNKSFTYRERLPDSKSGNIKVKFPNGDIKNQQAFFFKNTVSESGTTAIIEHIKNKTGELKILVDLATASKYQDDSYTFILQQNNLNEILAEGIK